MKQKMIAKIVMLGTLISSVQSFTNANNATDNTRTDNTKINQRDSAPQELTADEQPSNSSDMNITRRIRQDIMKEKNLSTYAKNVKIITVNGKVTLKGPVRSEQELNAIMNNARIVAGVSNVSNEMSVVTDRK
ncbi:MAG: phospholipid-binding protein [Bdellovibrionales bacterium CG10_big_fil_rev_8_21_14_0_10_45_34]|nr:MAG: phospholipid-binding protein [Bdellovibrionales bacterium CG10_big_fil_rev_8_21_14_0_10_45_34]